MVKLLAAFRKYNVELTEGNVDRVMTILRLNDKKHFDYLLQIYREGGRAITKEMKDKLGITRSAVYAREARLQKLGLIEIIPKNQSYYWNREVKLSSVVINWFENQSY